MTGKSYRVPLKTGSIVEVVANLGAKVCKKELKDAFRHAALSAPLSGVMAVLEQENASSRIVGETHSSLVDLPLINVLSDTLVSVCAWYDNEFGYANRLAEMAMLLNNT